MLSLVRALLSSFGTGHQCTALSSRLSKSSQIADRWTLLNLSSGILIDVDRDWRETEPTFNFVCDIKQRLAMSSFICKPFELASTAERISAVARLLPTRLIFRADQWFRCTNPPRRRNIIWPLRPFVYPAVTIALHEMMSTRKWLPLHGAIECNS